MIDQKKLAEILGSEIIGIGPAQIFPATTVIATQAVVLNEYQVGRLLRYMQGSDYENSEISLQWRTDGDCGPGVYFWEFDNAGAQFLPHESLLVNEPAVDLSELVTESEGSVIEQVLVKALASKPGGVLKVLTRIYNAGYEEGHIDTCEGGYVQVHRMDKATYHSDRVDDLLREIADVEKSGQ